MVLKSCITKNKADKKNGVEVMYHKKIEQTRMVLKSCITKNKADKKGVEVMYHVKRKSTTREMPEIFRDIFYDSKS